MRGRGGGSKYVERWLGTKARSLPYPKLCYCLFCLTPPTTPLTSAFPALPSDSTPLPSLQVPGGESPGPLHYPVPTSQLGGPAYTLRGRPKEGKEEVRGRGRMQPG